MAADLLPEYLALLETKRPADVSTGLVTFAGNQSPDIQRAT
jgi:hypothetical protein